MADQTLEIAKHQIEDLDRQITPLQDEVNRLIGMRDAWIVILKQAEKGSQIVWSPTVPQEAKVFSPEIEESTEEDLIDNSVDEEDTGDDYGGKIGAVREMFRIAYPKGLTASEIWKEVQEKGISRRRAFVYSTLSRLKKGEEIRKNRNGKYSALPKILEVDLEQNANGKEATEATS